MADELTTLLTATGGAFLGKFVGPAAEHYGKAALERAQQLGSKAYNYLTQVGREPQPVELKIFVPLVQAAALENEIFLADKWAALLANAADPIKRVIVEPSFCEVLRQLSVTQARMLQRVYEHSVPSIPRNQWLRKGVAKRKLMIEFSLSEDEYDVATDNLYRLQLCGNSTSDSEGMITIYEKGALCLLGYGYAFVTACTPPTH